MPGFPRLKTTAVAQDGVSVGLRFRTQVVRFADSSEQRFSGSSGRKRRWTVSLALLSDAERHLLYDFLESRQGRHGLFSFLDPWDNTEYANCSLEADSFEFLLEGPERSETTIRIVEN
jgi:hypothetical protein